MDERGAFFILTANIKTDANYIPRDYKTIGGMWTVDTWKLGDLQYQLMDEGYTSVIRGPGFVATDGYHGGTEHYTGQPHVVIEGDVEAFCNAAKSF